MCDKKAGVSVECTVGAYVGDQSVTQTFNVNAVFDREGRSSGDSALSFGVGGDLSKAIYIAVDNTVKDYLANMSKYA